MRRRGRFHAWAIRDGERRGGCLSRKFFGTWIPTHLRGCRIALFETRDAARGALPKARKAFPQARVAAVKVTVTAVAASRRARL